MKLQQISSSLLLLLTSDIQARQVLVDDPGTGNSVNLFETVPNVLGIPSKEDPTLKIESPVPVSILRYNDNMYLEGGQPVQKGDVYVIVKSNCASQDALTVDVQYTEYDRSAYSPWDDFSYTESISIDIIPSENVTLVDTEFLETSSFQAYWDYTSFWCASDPNVGFGTSSPAPTTNPDTPPSASPVGLGLSGNEGESQEELQAPPTPSPTARDDDDSASVPRSGMIATMIASVASAAILLRDGAAPGRKTGLRAAATLAILGAIVVTFQALGQTEITQNQQTTETSPRSHGRRLLEVSESGETCVASVEIIVDACRRAYLVDRADLEVTTPALHILDVDLTQLSSQQDPDSPCTTDYVAFLDFNETKATQPLATERAATQQTYIVPSLTDDWQAGIQCARAVEGRPFVDADGNRLQASMCMESDALTAWSAEKSALEGTISPDEALGQEWADRALGEHASIPAFAAFTIALMSNNAPPILVQDSLSAAMDEVRHAQTSFEAASLLLGTTVEPGPVPPSVHSFEPDMTQLAMAAAQEGCIDETLSALVAAYEVDTRLDEITSIDQATISVLKDKMRIIALEETRHSALAFSTVRWACEVDSAACSAVRGGPFQEENLIQAFEKRFGHFNVNAGAMNAYARVHHILVPFVVENKRHEEFIDCNQSMARTLDEGSTLMEQMADHIIHNTICGSMA